MKVRQFLFHFFSLLTAILIEAFIITNASFATTWDVNVTNNPGNMYSPSTLIIQTGDTVRWTWVSGFHSVTSGVAPSSPDGNFLRSPTSTIGTTYSVTFDSAFLVAHPALNNLYNYYCSVHGTMMTATIQVQDPTPTPTATPTATATATSTSTSTPTGIPTLTPTVIIPTATPVPTSIPSSLSILGSVTMSQKPIPGVEVSNGVSKSVTNLKGQYSFAGLAPKTYELTADKAGFEIISEDGSTATVISSKDVVYSFLAQCKKGFILKGDVCTQVSAPVPAIPKLNSVKAKGSSIEIKFSTARNAKKYNVYRSTAEGEIGTIVKKLSTLSLIDKNVLKDVKYFYLISAFNKNGESGFSKQKSASVISH